MHLWRRLGGSEAKQVYYDRRDASAWNGELSDTNDLQRKKKLFAAAISHIVDSRVLTTIQNVIDNHVMTFGDTGFMLYQSKWIPKDFNWTLLAIESDCDVRETGQ